MKISFVLGERAHLTFSALVPPVCEALLIFWNWVSLSLKSVIHWITVSSLGTVYRFQDCGIIPAAEG